MSPKLNPLTNPLVQAQKQIQALFLRPVRLEQPHQVPDWLQVWYRHFAGVSDAQQPPEYKFGLANLQGVAISQLGGSKPQREVIDVYLKSSPGTPGVFQQFLRGLFPSIPIRFVVTGEFFPTALGDEICIHSLAGDPHHPIGTVGLFLKDTTGKTYALTCYHVLPDPRKNPPQDVDIEGVDDAKLSSYIPLVAGEFVDPSAPDPEPPNQVDCALAKLNSASQSNAVPGMAGASVTSVTSAQKGMKVTILNGKYAQGEILTTQADLSIPYGGGLGAKFFDDLTAITGATVQRGDSGSLVICTDDSSDKTAVGLVMAYSGHATTLPGDEAGDGEDLGAVVIACEIQKILANLNALPTFAGAPLSLA